MDQEALKNFIRDLIDEEFGPRPVELSKRWVGGQMVLQPANDTQAKEVPLEIFFKKLLTVRDALRVLEQKINSHPQLSAEDKATFHGYITKSYGTLTSFNILFKEDKDKFVGSGSGGSEEKAPGMTVGEAKRRLGLNEY